ncbi:MAG: hypothetical protein GY926_03945 [bacterium]|nr:hypothetical protein [bacterium]
MTTDSETPASGLTLEDVATLVDGASEIGPATAERLSRLISAHPLCADQIARLEGMASDAGLDAELEARLSAALGCSRDLDLLLESRDWRHPSEVLDPDGERGIAYRSLIRAADARIERSRSPELLLESRRKLERAEAAERAEEDLVACFVDGLLDRPPERAERLLRLADSRYRRQSSGTGAAAP